MREIEVKIDKYEQSKNWDSQKKGQARDLHLKERKHQLDGVDRRGGSRGDDREQSQETNCHQPRMEHSGVLGGLFQVLQGLTKSVQGSGEFRSGHIGHAKRRIGHRRQ